MNRWIEIVLDVAVLIAVILIGVNVLNASEVWRAVSSFDWGNAPPILAASAAYLLVVSYRFALLVAPLSGLDVLTSMRAYAAGQVATLIPGGIAARTVLLHQAGVPYARGAVPVLLSSLSSQTVLLASGLVAALWVPSLRRIALLVLAGVVLAGLLAALPPVRRLVGRGLDAGARRLGHEDVWREFVRALSTDLKSHVVLAAVGLTVLGACLHVAMLAMVLRGLGSEVSLSLVVLAYVVPSALGRLSGLPGGIGVTELGMTGFLASAGVGTNTAAAAAGMLRIASVLFIALLGGVVYLLAWHGSREGDDPPTGEDGASGSAAVPRKPRPEGES